MHRREELLWAKITVAKGTKKPQSNPKYGYGVKGLIRAELRRFYQLVMGGIKRLMRNQGSKGPKRVLLVGN